MNEISLLISACLFIGLTHTLLGPDHYLPLIMMYWARGWSLARLRWMALLFAFGHVASTVILVSLGINGLAIINRFSPFDLVGESFALILLAALGLAYFFWGLRSARAKSGAAQNGHQHFDAASPKIDLASMAPFALISILILGPCEPMLPLLFLSRSMENVLAFPLSIAAFGLATAFTMLLTVEMGARGIRSLPVAQLSKYSHSIAGATITFTALGVYLLEIN